MEERFNEVPLPPKKQTKSKPFGTGQRFKPMPVLRPSPASYTIPTVFEMEKYKKKGKSISVFREKPPLCDVPGPGKYEGPNQFDGPLFSIGLKLKEKKSDNFPAPNVYDQKIVERVSKYKNFGCTLIK